MGMLDKLEVGAFQRSVLRRDSLKDHEKVLRITKRFRKTPWVNGVPADIRRGNYAVCCERFDPSDKKVDLSLYNAITAPDNGSDFMLGWSTGLKNNVAMTIGGIPVLAADNHDMALPFLIDLVASGMLRKRARLIHVDAHSDDGTPRTFTLKGYLSRHSRQGKLMYIVENAGIGKWIEPLIKSGFISSDWKWANISMDARTWQLRDPETRKAKPLNSLLSLLRGRNTIVDVDLDVLLPLDDRLSALERSRIERLGYIPERLRPKLEDIADLAMKGNAVTMVTSPCFISQQRAIVYMKYILKLMCAASQISDN